MTTVTESWCGQSVERGYNEDDCISALRLRDWLESLRTGLEAKGHEVPRPQPKESGASENVTQREQRVTARRARLLEGVSLEPGTRDADQEARWLLAYLLDWHRREDKASWWEYFRLLGLPEEDLFDEPRAIAGLEFVERVRSFSAKRASRPGLTGACNLSCATQQLSCKQSCGPGQ